jgi:hypothetical protein
VKTRSSTKQRVFFLFIMIVLAGGLFVSARLIAGSQESTAASIPVVTSTPTVSLTREPTATALSFAATKGAMWITRDELMSLPTSGSAWESMNEVAYGDWKWKSANLRDQDNKHHIYVLACAFVYARTGDASLQAKVRDGIVEAKQSMDEESEWQTDNGVLAASRQIGSYVIAADLIDLQSFDPAADVEFRNWLRIIRTTDIGTHGRFTSITQTCENAASNWSGYACASRIAASIYLEDAKDVQRAANILRAWMGEREYYPADAPGENGYFQHTRAYESSWACDEANWTGVSPPCIKSGVDINGALLEDASRGGGCCTLRGEGIEYSWEVLQGAYFAAELLYRANFGNPYEWSDQALKRALDFMERSGWGMTSPATSVPWLANARYGTSYPTEPTIDARIMSWGGWLYQK